MKVILLLFYGGIFFILLCFWWSGWLYYKHNCMLLETPFKASLNEFCQEYVANKTNYMFFLNDPSILNDVIWLDSQKQTGYLSILGEKKIIISPKDNDGIKWSNKVTFVPTIFPSLLSRQNYIFIFLTVLFFVYCIFFCNQFTFILIFNGLVFSIFMVLQINIYNYNNFISPVELSSIFLDEATKTNHKDIAYSIKKIADQEMFYYKNGNINFLRIKTSPYSYVYYIADVTNNDFSSINSQMDFTKIENNLIIGKYNKLIAQKNTYDIFNVLNAFAWSTLLLVRFVSCIKEVNRHGKTGNKLGV